MIFLCLKVAKKQFELAIDRLHTFFKGYIEVLCEVEDDGEPVKLTPTGDYSNYKRKVTKFLKKE